MTFAARNLRSLGRQMSIQIPKDHQGYFGRECAVRGCKGYFKIKPGTGLTGSNLPCHCPYCGHTARHDHFWTPEQIKYAESVAFRKVSDAFFKDLKRLEFDYQPKGKFAIGLRLEVKEGRRVPIRHYREKRLETEVVCEHCTLHYAIYGLFGFCPDCRTHNSFQILSKNLDLVHKQLDLTAGLIDRTLQRHLIEDALENCVSAFDGFGREVCRVRAHRSTDPNHAQSVSFQNPNRFADRLVKLFAVDPRTGVSSACWSAIHRGFMKRHVVAHRSGVVDAQYRAETSDRAAIVGRRVPLDENEVRELADQLRSIGQWIVASLPPP